MNSTKRSSSLPHNNLTYDNNKTNDENFNNQNSVLLKTTMNTFDNLRVVIRLRPPLQREMESDLPFRSIVKFNVIYRDWFLMIARVFH